MQRDFFVILLAPSNSFKLKKYCKMKLLALATVCVLAMCVKGNVLSQTESEETDLTKEDLKQLQQLESLLNKQSDETEKRNDLFDNYDNAELQQALRDLEDGADDPDDENDDAADNIDDDLSEEELNKIKEALDNDDATQKRFLGFLGRILGCVIVGIARAAQQLLSRLSSAFKFVGTKLVSLTNKIATAIKTTSWRAVLDLVDYMDQVKRLIETAEEKIQVETGDAKEAAQETLAELEELLITLPDAIRDLRHEVCKMTKCTKSGNQCHTHGCGACKSKTSGWWSSKKTKYYCS